MCPKAHMGFTFPQKLACVFFVALGPNILELKHGIKDF